MPYCYIRSWTSLQDYLVAVSSSFYNGDRSNTSFNYCYLRTMVKGLRVSAKSCPRQRCILRSKSCPRQRCILRSKSCPRQRCILLLFYEVVICQQGSGSYHLCTGPFTFVQVHSPLLQVYSPWVTKYTRFIGQYKWDLNYL